MFVGYLATTSFKDSDPDVIGIVSIIQKLTSKSTDKNCLPTVVNNELLGCLIGGVSLKYQNIS